MRITEGRSVTVHNANGQCNITHAIHIVTRNDDRGESPRHVGHPGQDAADCPHIHSPQSPPRFAVGLMLVEGPNEDSFREGLSTRSNNHLLQ
jgi:hypothetical protein